MSLSFANNNLTYDNGGNDSLGCTEIVMRIIFVKENEEMTDILKLAYEVSFHSLNLDKILISVFFIL